MSDPLDTVRPGQSATGCSHGPLCGARSIRLGPNRRYFICTRPPHTHGQHVAAGDLLVLATWQDGEAPAVLGMPAVAG